MPALFIPGLTPRRAGCPPRVAMLALIALALTLGRWGTPAPGLWTLIDLLPPPLLPVAGAGFAAAAGLLAYAVVRGGEGPCPAGASRADLALPALIAVATLMPGMGTAALAVPATVALAARRPTLRAATLLLTAAGCAAAEAAVPASLAALAALAAGWRGAIRFAANDNPSLERSSTKSRVWLPARHAIAQRTYRIGGFGEYPYVQQQ